MDECVCTKEAEIATLIANQQSAKEMRVKQYEDLKADLAGLDGGLSKVMVMLRGDGNGNAGIIPRLISLEDSLRGIGQASEDTKDCLYVNAGTAKVKIPISKGSLKAIGCGAVIILMLTGQVNVHSPLAQDIIGGLVKLIGG